MCSWYSRVCCFIVTTLKAPDSSICLDFSPFLSGLSRFSCNKLCAYKGWLTMELCPDVTRQGSVFNLSQIIFLSTNSQQIFIYFVIAPFLSALGRSVLLGCKSETLFEHKFSIKEHNYTIFYKATLTLLHYLFNLFI